MNTIHCLVFVTTKHRKVHLQRLEIECYGLNLIKNDALCATLLELIDFRLTNCGTNRFVTFAKIRLASYKSEQILSNMRLSEFRRRVNLNIDLSSALPALDSAA